MPRTTNNVVLHEQDIAIVSSLADKLGISFSGGIRVIIRDWNRRTDRQPLNSAELIAEAAAGPRPPKRIKRARRTLPQAQEKEATR